RHTRWPRDWSSDVCSSDLIVGERAGDVSDYVRELHRMRDAMTIARRVTFHPFTNDTRPAYRAMDVFVLASHCETFGMVLQEAMEIGRASCREGVGIGGVGV